MTELHSFILSGVDFDDELLYLQPGQLIQSLWSEEVDDLADLVFYII